MTKKELTLSLFLLSAPFLMVPTIFGIAKGLDDDYASVPKEEAFIAVPKAVVKEFRDSGIGNLCLGAGAVCLIGAFSLSGSKPKHQA